MTYEALRTTADARAGAVAQCEQAGGHDYAVHGFSAILHPDTQWHGRLPTPPVAFSSYACAHCGNRVAPAVAHAYVNRRLRMRHAADTVRQDLVRLYGSVALAQELFPWCFEGPA